MQINADNADKILGILGIFFRWKLKNYAENESTSFFSKQTKHFAQKCWSAFLNKIFNIVYFQGQMVL